MQTTMQQQINKGDTVSYYSTGYKDEITGVVVEVKRNIAKVKHTGKHRKWPTVRINCNDLIKKHS